MIDRGKTIRALDCCLDIVRSGRWASGCIACPYADEKNNCREKMILDALALLKEQPEVVRCKDCEHRGKPEKCVLAAISEEKDYPLFMLDNRGEWFCADGERSESE